MLGSKRMVLLRDLAAGIAVESPQAMRYEMAEDLERIARPAAQKNKKTPVFSGTGVSILSIRNSN